MSADRRQNLEALRQELRELRAEFDSRTKELELAIQRLESRWNDEDVLVQANLAEAHPPAEVILEEALPEPAVPVEPDVVSAPYSDTPMDPPEADPVDIPATEIPRLPPEDRPEPGPRKPGRIEEALNGVAAALAGLFAPLLSLLERGVGIYRDYQRQGKAPVFLLTLAGIVAMLAGVGYLLRLSVGSLDAAGRTGIGFAAGVGFVITGSILAKRQPDYRAYGSSLIGLGLAIAYLCTYFLGPYFELVGETISLGVLVAVTVAAYVLALLFETRVVALITLLGGAFTPFILGDSVVGDWYLGYLLLLAVASIHLCRAIAWPLLGQLTILISIGMLETVEFVPGTHWWLRAALLHGFFYLFVVHLAWGQGAVNADPNKSTLGMLTGLAFYLLYAGLNLPAPDLARGLAFVADGALLAVAFFVLRLRFTALAPVAVLMIGLVTAGAIFVLAPPELGAALWTLEALSLVWLGFTYRHAMIRIEGYTLGLLSAAALGYEVFAGFVGPDGTLAFGIHWLALGGLLLAGLILAWIARRNTDQWSLLDRVALWSGDEAATVLGMALVYLVLAAIDPTLALIGVPLGIGWALLRASWYRRSLSEIVGLLQLIIPLLYVLGTTRSSQDFLVVLRDSWNWWCLVLLGGAGWLLAGLYQTVFAHCARRRTVRFLRWLTYCVPAVWCGFWAIALIQGWVTGRPAAFDAKLLEFTIMGIILWGMWGLARLDRCIDAPPIVREIVSVWISMVVLYVTAVIAPTAVALVGGLLILGLLAWSLWRDLPASETLAWAHFAFPVYGILTGAIAAGTWSFSSQTLITQMTWVELFVVGWLALTVYQWLAPDRPTCKRAANARALVYLALPLAFVPHVIRHHPLFLAASLWGSMVIAWVLHRFTRQASLVWEVRVVAGIAILATLAQWVDSPHPDFEAWIAIGAALFALAGLVLAESAWRNSPSQSLFAWPLILTPYVLCLVLGAVVFDLSGVASWAWAVAGCALLALQSVPPGRLLVGNAALAGVAALAFLVLAQWTIHGAHSTLAAAIGFLIATAATATALFSKAALWRGFRNTLGRTMILHIVTQASIVVGYAGISTQVTGSPAGVVTSICMVIHATALLFTTINPEYQRLIRFAIVLFATAAGKVLLVDMRGFNMTHKMIMLLIIGGVLLAGAFLYQRLQGRHTATEDSAA